MAALPIEPLIKRWGEMMEIDAAMLTLLCSSCGERSVKAEMLMLCEPGCRRQRQ